MNEYEELINTIDEVIKSGVGSSDYMIGKIEMSIDLFRQTNQLDLSPNFFLFLRSSTQQSGQS